MKFPFDTTENIYLQTTAATTMAAVVPVKCSPAENGSSRMQWVYMKAIYNGKRHRKIAESNFFII